jgi:hypothetical protein
MLQDFFILQLQENPNLLQRALFFNGMAPHLTFLEMSVFLNETWRNAGFVE